MMEKLRILLWISLRQQIECIDEFFCTRLQQWSNFGFEDAF
jgi:hypothetical protein